MTLLCAPLLLLLLGFKGITRLTVEATSDFKFAYKVDCPSVSDSKDVVSCAVDCSQDTLCNGFAVSPDAKCWKVARLLALSSGPCRLFLRPRFGNLRGQCPQVFDIAVPSSPDRLFSYMTGRRELADIAPTCERAGGEIADLYQGNSMLELRETIYKFTLSKTSSSCMHFSENNVQCNLVIGARTMTDGKDRWIQSQASFGPMKAKFDSITHSTCNTYFTMTIWINSKRQYLFINLKCVSSGYHLYTPVCQCKL